MVKDIIVIYRKKWNYFDFNQFENVNFRLHPENLILNLSTP